MGQDAEILIAGGGIGGLSAALALAHAGRRVRVLEKAAEFTEIGYGIQMGPNVHPMLERLGVARAIEPHAVYPDALVLADGITGKELTRIALRAPFLERYKYRYFVIHRRDLHGAILDACRGRDEIALEASKGVVRFDDRGDRVLVTCEDGSEYAGAALIGADGLWSPTRAAVIGDGPPRMAGHFVYRGVVPSDKIIDRSHENSMIIYIGPNLHLVQYRLRGGTVMNNVATIASYRYARGEQDCGGPDELEEMFARCDPRVRQMLDYVGKDRNWVLHDRPPVSGWTRGNVTLLGDAAHPMLQYLAQGACMAIEDAVVLGAKVGAGTTDFNSAFVAYQRERFYRTARVQITARVFGDIIHADGGARELRNHLCAQRDPDFPYEVDWLYRGITILS
ncbi:MAG TPA: FAD-dependent monooxygenase [Burkholderiales bacterium]|nr:FAD-dependent monooxygenase [Burkholderiales bacterium]